MAVLALIKGVQLSDRADKWSSVALEDDNLHKYFERSKQSPIPQIRVEKMSQSESSNGPVCQQDDQSKRGQNGDIWQRRDSSRGSQSAQLSADFKGKCQTKSSDAADKKYKHRLSSDGAIMRSTVYKDANANERKSSVKRHTTVNLPVTQKSSLFDTDPARSPSSPDARKNVQFTFNGTDSSSDNESTDSGKKQPRSPATKDSGREARKQRFKKMLQPLRRSHSAASTKDIPAHALFLRNKEPTDGGEHIPVKKTSSSESGNAYNDLEELEIRKKKTSLSKNMKQKLSFLRRRNTDSVLVQPSLEDVQSWGRSFDNLLYDKYGLALFRGFLRTEFSDENIDFWIACEEYRSVVKGHKLSARAQQIYEEYVAVQSPREVNLDSKTRLSTISSITSPDRNTFELAQHRIQALMEKDSYPRFLRSDIYQKMLRSNPTLAGSSSALAATVAATASTARAIMS